MRAASNRSVRHLICGGDYINDVSFLTDDKNWCEFHDEDIIVRIANFASKVQEHRSKLNLIAEKIGYNFSNHDFSKLEVKDILIPLTVCDYYRRNNKSNEMPDNWKKALTKAQQLHYVFEKHHPEHFILQFNDKKAVNLMTKKDIVEMCIDWAISAEEFAPAGQKGDARDFAKNNIAPSDKFPMLTGKRWEFNSEKTLLILKTIDKIYERS